jgi:ABC-type nitrate/sulfonate/bicarbonate transport system substrate-binding protein
LDSLKTIDKTKLKKMESVLECYHALITELIDAFVLWEPHYYAFQNFENVGVMNMNESDSNVYDWFLSLVAKREYTENNEQIAQKILWGIKDAANFCQSKENRERVIKDCASFLNPEFTGIGEEELRKLLKDQPTILFSVDEATKGLFKKLDSLLDKGEPLARGAKAIDKSLWNGLSWPKVAL